MKKVLIIAYQFPPMGGPGVQRTTKFVKHLRSFGWEPVIFTREIENMDLKDETLLKDLPAGVKVIRTKAYDFTELTGIFKLPGKFLSRKVFIPDGERPWQIFNKDSALKTLKEEKIDLIYTTSYPYSDHLMGLYLKERVPNIPWVADFRDEWTSNPYLLDSPHYGLRMNIEKKMEKKVLDSADCLITNSPIMMENFVKNNNLSGDDFYVIPNGYDNEDFEGVSKDKLNNKKFTITYTGSFYGRRKPDKFFEAIGLLIEENRIDKNKIHVQLIGNYIVKRLNEMINQYKLSGIVHVLPYMKHRDSIRELINSDASLLIVGPGPGAEAFYTGKIFEYINTGRPILGLVPENGVAADVIRETKTGLVSDSRDVNKIKANVLKLYNDWNSSNHEFNPKWELIEQYERKRLTGKLSEVFERAIIKGRQR